MLDEPLRTSAWEAIKTRVGISLNAGYTWVASTTTLLRYVCGNFCFLCSHMKYHHCPFKVKEGKVFSRFQEEGRTEGRTRRKRRELRPAWPSPSRSCHPTLFTSSEYFRVSTVNGEVKQSVEQFTQITLQPIKSM